MKRLIPALAVTLLLAATAPAGAHYQGLEDPMGDAYEAGDTSGVALESRFDATIATFQDFKKTYQFMIFMLQSFDTSMICDVGGCPSDPVGMGYFDIEFFRLKNGKASKGYVVQVRSDGDALVATLFKGTIDKVGKLIKKFPAELVQDFQVNVVLPRKHIKNQPIGKKIGWNVVVGWWNDPAEDEVCLADLDAAFWNACIDRVPDSGYAEHKIRL